MEVGAGDAVALEGSGAAVAPGLVLPPVQAVNGSNDSATRTARMRLRRTKDGVQDVMVSYSPR
ncbi:MAG TPA: hypothetical protein VLT34_02660 [Arthrobacter sp.]|nr:hypothetical protein [Arthrobacter sp.]